MSKLNPKDSIAKLKDAGRRVREHLQRPALERSLSIDPLFRDEESDDIMRPSIIPGVIQTSTSAAQPPLQAAQPASSVTFSDTPVLLGRYADEPLSGSDEEILPSISEVNMLQAPSPMYRRYASFTDTSTFISAGQQQLPRSPFDTIPQATVPVQTAVPDQIAVPVQASVPVQTAVQPTGHVLLDQPILSGGSDPTTSRKFSRYKSGEGQASILHITNLALCRLHCLSAPAEWSLIQHRNEHTAVQ